MTIGEMSKFCPLLSSCFCNDCESCGYAEHMHSIYMAGYEDGADKSEKYGWHNCEENKEDLPGFGESVEAIARKKGGLWVKIVRCFTHLKLLPLSDVSKWEEPWQYFNEDYDIIRWRRVKPVVAEEELGR